MITYHFIVPLGYRIKLGLMVKWFLNMKGLCGDIWLKMKMVRCIATTETRSRSYTCIGGRTQSKSVELNHLNIHFLLKLFSMKVLLGVLFRYPFLSKYRLRVYLI